MIAESLISPRPHPDIPVSERIFAPFIGNWDLRVTWYATGEIVRQEEGEWHFAWVLEGRAVQDVWIVPRRERRATAPDLYEYGTSVRFYDHSLGLWRSTWIGPMHGLIRSFVARQIGGTVVLDTDPGQGDPMRWEFSDVTENAFVWRNWINRDGRWALQQDFMATRARPD